jgi:hypothetical protein
MKFPQMLTTIAVVGVLAFAGCGDDDSDNNGSASTAGAPTQTGGQTPTDGGQTPAGGEDAVNDAILKWTFEGSCDVMTDKFLEEQSFIGDSREERCDYFQKAYVKPQYSEDDLKFRSVQVSGDTATVVVGSDIANIESEYKLVNDGGTWKIDEAGLK